MSSDDLLKMFDLDAPDAEPDGGLEISEAGAASAARPAVPHALVQDLWSARRGHDLVAAGGMLENAGVSAEAAADFHQAAYDPAPTLADGPCTDPLRYEFMADLLQTEDFRTLNSQTALDPLAAEIASGYFAQGFAALQKDREGQSEPAPDDARGSLKRGLQSYRAAAGAAKEAREGVAEARDAAAACGLGPGDEGGKLDPARVAAVYKRVRGNESLRKIIEAAGRFRRVAQSRRRRRTVHGSDEVVGVELGGDLSKLVPSELASLADEDLELDALRRLVERQAMQRETRATEPEGKGPVCILVDTSGSMRGEKVETAKGLALAMAWVARRQRRWVALASFSRGPQGSLCVLPPGKWDEAALFTWLESFGGGGTDWQYPFGTVPFDLWPTFGFPKGKIDMLCVTDGEINFPDDAKARFLAWKRDQKCRLLSLVVESRTAGALQDVSDEIHHVRGLDPDQEAVAKTLDF